MRRKIAFLPAGHPHGFGYREDWFDAYDSFLTDAFSSREKE